MASGTEKYRRPELVLSDLLNERIRDATPAGFRLLRAVVLAVDLEGAKLQNKAGSGTFQAVDVDGKKVDHQASVGPDNPRGAIQARILTDGLDRFRPSSASRIFWPFFPVDQLSFPVCPKEHVYVLFEDRDESHGLWLSRVSGHDSSNFYVGSNSYQEIGSSAIDSFETKDDTYEKSDADAGLSSPVDPTRFFDG